MSDPALGLLIAVLFIACALRACGPSAGVFGGTGGNDKR